MIPGLLDGQCMLFGVHVYPRKKRKNKSRPHCWLPKIHIGAQQLKITVMLRLDAMFLLSESYS